MFFYVDIYVYFCSVKFYSMRNSKRLLLEQIDRKIGPFKATEKIIIPEKGWINAIRTALNMTMEQLGSKLNLTKQGIKKIEEREASDSITLKTLKQVAKAFDMKLVYAFIPKENSLENLVELKAESLARKIVLRTNQNMKLENQGNSEEQIFKAILELKEELKQEINKSIWD